MPAVCCSLGSVQRVSRAFSLKTAAGDHKTERFLAVKTKHESVSADAWSRSIVNTTVRDFNVLFY